VHIVADLVGGCMAPLAKWIWSGLSEGQPIDLEEVVQDTCLKEADLQ